MASQDEATFLAEYDPSKYDPVAVSVDVVVLTVRNDTLSVIALRRDTHPFKGKWALPGAFVKPVEVLHAGEIFLPLPEYANLALETKVNLTDVHVEQLYSFGAPDRDPRMHVISVGYLAFAPNIPDPVPGTHVAEATLLSVEEATSVRLAPEWAFDHRQMVLKGIERARAKMEYTTLATKFLPEEFTIPELQAVYAAVWGQSIDAGNFYRKVKATDGFIEPVKGKRDRAQLYRAGDLLDLYPPIRRGGWL